jgi:hypothetical protein
MPVAPYPHLPEIRGNPLLKEDLLTPSVFYIRSVSLLDGGLDVTIKSRGLTVPASYLGRGRKLYLDGRIRFLNDQGALQNGARLHEIRERRNALAHDINADVDWRGFEADADEAERTLRLLRCTEAGAVAEFRKLANQLRRPVHKKFYLGTKGMALAVAIDIAMSLYLTYEMMRSHGRVWGDLRRDIEVVRQSRRAASTTE